ncbi:MAG TPA: HAMP domain-containing sensor histidine kinase [Gemmatimonadales bacterium]
MAEPVRSLRTELLVSLGFVTSAAVILVGLTTLLLTGGDLRDTIRPLGALWLGSTAVFVVFGMSVLHRLVIRPLHRLTAEADALAAREFQPAQADYGSVELDRLAARYRAMAEDLLDVQSHMVRVEKLAGIGRLAAGVAHEVRNPLGALGTYVEVLQRRGTDPAVTDDMRCAIERIERIVQGLVDYARPGRPADNGSATASTDLNGAVRRVMDFLRAQGTFRDHAVDVALAAGLPRVRGDEHLLEQVVVNLVVNACQAAPRGRVVVGTVAKSFDTREAAPTTEPRRRRRVIPDGVPGVLLYVADDGPGVPEEDRERIFDPFYTTKDPGEGTGLGLAIVARTVHESGGVIWVDRSREGGAVFMVFLPIASETDAAADR